tara:strand:- start:354 stop:539 length:186 start_codon:yes stop_codon:yes gene_type:complete
MKPGDMIICKGFGPRGIIGDTGVLIRRRSYPFDKCWKVLIDGKIYYVVETTFKVISEASKI